MRVVCLVSYEVESCICQFERDVSLSKSLAQLVGCQSDDALDLILGERAEQDDVVDPVEELRLEVSSQLIENVLFHLLIDSAVFFHVVEELGTSDVRCHDADRVGEVYSPALVVSKSAVIKKLQQDVEYIRMSLFDLVEEDDAVRLAAYRLCELAAFVISNVPRRRSYQPGYGVLLHVLGHVDPDDVLLCVEERFRQSLAQLSLTYTGRSEENERAYRSVVVGKSRSRSQDSFGNGCYGFVLSDDPLVEDVRQSQQLVPFSLYQLAYRDACPCGDDLGDLVLCYLF